MIKERWDEIGKEGKILFFIVIACFIIFGMWFIPNASAYLGTFQAGQCLQLLGVSDAPNMTLISITYPKNSTTIYPNADMTFNAGTFNYTFCDTGNLGEYSYAYKDGFGNYWANAFTINVPGQAISQSQTSLIWIGIIILVGATIFFFVLSMLFKYPAVKIFFMALSVLTLIVLIGIVSFNADIYLAEFPTLVSIYSTYYILIVSLAGAAMLGLIVWLIYYSFQAFNKSRGRDSSEYDID